MSDNIILLRFMAQTEMVRTIRVLKTRGTAHDNREHHVEITNEGVIIKKL